MVSSASGDYAQVHDARDAGCGEGGVEGPLHGDLARRSAGLGVHVHADEGLGMARGRKEGESEAGAKHGCGHLGYCVIRN